MLITPKKERNGKKEEAHATLFKATLIHKTV